jgi:hypothetical protein
LALFFAGHGSFTSLTLRSGSKEKVEEGRNDKFSYLEIIEPLKKMQRTCLVCFYSCVSGRVMLIDLNMVAASFPKVIFIAFATKITPLQERNSLITNLLLSLLHAPKDLSLDELYQVIEKLKTTSISDQVSENLRFYNAQAPKEDWGLYKLAQLISKYPETSTTGEQLRIIFKQHMYIADDSGQLFEELETLLGSSDAENFPTLVEDYLFHTRMQKMKSDRDKVFGTLKMNDSPLMKQLGNLFSSCTEGTANYLCSVAAAIQSLLENPEHEGLIKTVIILSAGPPSSWNFLRLWPLGGSFKITQTGIVCVDTNTKCLFTELNGIELLEFEAKLPLFTENDGHKLMQCWDAVENVIFIGKTAWMSQFYLGRKLTRLELPHVVCWSELMQTILRMIFLSIEQ